MFLCAVCVCSCEDVDNTMYDVLDGVQRGAAIRTLEVVSANYNVFDPGSTFEIVVEEQDEEFSINTVTDNKLNYAMKLFSG